MGWWRRGDIGRGSRSFSRGRGNVVINRRRRRSVNRGRRVWLPRRSRRRWRRIVADRGLLARAGSGVGHAGVGTPVIATQTMA